MGIGSSHANAPCVMDHFRYPEFEVMSQARWEGIGNPCEHNRASVSAVKDHSTPHQAYGQDGAHVLEDVANNDGAGRSLGF